MKTMRKKILFILSLLLGAWLMSGSIGTAAAETQPPCCAAMEKGEPCHCHDGLQASDQSGCDHHGHCTVVCVSHASAAALMPAPRIALIRTVESWAGERFVSIPLSPVDLVSKPPRS